MINYLLFDVVIIFLLLVVDVWVLRTNVTRDRGFWKRLLVLMILTSVFDNIITGLPIVTYPAYNITGLHLGFMPLEDFGYALGFAIMVPMIWRYLEKH